MMDWRLIIIFSCNSRPGRPPKRSPVSGMVSPIPTPISVPADRATVVPAFLGFAPSSKKPRYGDDPDYGSESKCSFLCSKTECHVTDNTLTDLFSLLQVQTWSIIIAVTIIRIGGKEEETAQQIAPQLLQLCWLPMDTQQRFLSFNTLQPLKATTIPLQHNSNNWQQLQLLLVYLDFQGTGMMMMMMRTHARTRFT